MSCGSTPVIQAPIGTRVPCTLTKDSNTSKAELIILDDAGTVRAADVDPNAAPTTTVAAPTSGLAGGGPGRA